VGVYGFLLISYGNTRKTRQVKNFEKKEKKRIERVIFGGFFEKLKPK
jgi:hypothetical protein